MPFIHFPWTVLVYGNLSCSSNRVAWTLLLSRKRAPGIILNIPAGRSVGPPPNFSSNTTIEAVMKGKHLLTTDYISLLGPYLQYVLSTFNTCSRGPTHQSLTNTGRCYNLRDASLSYHTPLPSQPTVLCFSPKGSVPVSSY
jgi:hypothetical protein